MVYSLSEKIKVGQRRARDEGRLPGRRSGLGDGVRDRICGEYGAGESLRAIAAGLMADGVLTSRGNTVWHASSVRAVLVSSGAVPGAGDTSGGVSGVVGVSATVSDARKDSPGRWAVVVVSTDDSVRRRVWSTHPTRKGADRLLASAVREWGRQPGRLKERWQWLATPIQESACPLHDRVTKARQAIMNGVFWDAPTKHEPIGYLRSEPVEIPGDSTPRVRIATSGNSGVFCDNYVLNQAAISHRRYLSDVLVDLFGASSDGMMGIKPLSDDPAVLEDLNEAMNTTAGAAGTAWTVQRSKIRAAFIDTGHFFNLNDL